MLLKIVCCDASAYRSANAPSKRPHSITPVRSISFGRFCKTPVRFGPVRSPVEMILALRLFLIIFLLLYFVLRHAYLSIWDVPFRHAGLRAFFREDRRRLGKAAQNPNAAKSTKKLHFCKQAKRRQAPAAAGTPPIKARPWPVQIRIFCTLQTHTKRKRRRCKERKRPSAAFRMAAFSSTTRLK